MSSDNPYAAPLETSNLETQQSSWGENQEELAGRLTRLAAAIIDGLLVLLIVGPIQLFSGYLGRAMEQRVGPIEMLIMSLVGVVVFLLVHGYLLMTRGQTVGKLLTQIQIVDFEKGQLLPPLRVYVFRYLWTLPLLIPVMFIPGTYDDMLVNLIILIGVLMIFGSQRRCLHDHIAGSKVVLYRPERQSSV